MSNLLRPNRKGSDEAIRQMISIGRSVTAIARRLSCNPSSVCMRLKHLKLGAADARRNFMDDVLAGFSDQECDQLAQRLESTGNLSIHDHVRNLLRADLLQNPVPQAPVNDNLVLTPQEENPIHGQC